MANTKTSGLTALAGASIDAEADSIPLLDSSASELKRVLAGNIRSMLIEPNVLINGGFDFAQRQAPGTLTAITTDKYSADRWRISRETASLQYARIDTNGALETGLTGRYYGQFKQITSAGKFAIYQPVEAINTFPLASRVVSFQCKLKASSSKTIRLGLVQLNSSGTVDTINATVVPTWGANSTDPTLATNHARITPSAAVSNGSVSGSGISCSVTTSWQQFGGVFTMPSNAKNIIPMLWTDSQFSANDSLYVAEAGLYDGSALRAWLPRLTQHELALCQRYFLVIGDRDVTYEKFGFGPAGFTTAAYMWMAFPVHMRIIPTFSSSAAGDFILFDGVSIFTCTSLASNVASNWSFELNAGVASGLTTRQWYSFQRDNTDAARLYFDAEL